MSILVVVPARGASMRLQRKNLMRLGGRSLLAWTAAAAKAALPGNPVLLTTDDPSIAEAGRELGLEVPFLRPPALATDTSTTADAVIHALDFWCDRAGDEPALLVLLQPTSPFRPVELVREGVELMARQDELEALISVMPVHVGSASIYHNADGDGFLEPLDAGAANRRCVVPSGALYVIRPSVLRCDSTFVPSRTLSVTHSGPSAIDIDTPDDWALAEAMVAANLVAFPGDTDQQAKRTARA